MPTKPKITLVPGKTYTYSGTEGSYSVVVGEILEGDAVTPESVPILSYGNSAPGSGTGKVGDIHIDKVNFKIYTKGADGWDAGSEFKGAVGSTGPAGLRGKTTLEGEGPPGTGTNLASATSALQAALLDEGLSSGDLTPGDLYLDTTNHRFYKKTSQGWVPRNQFKGVDGTSGLDGKRGKTTLEGDGPPGTGTNLATPTSALTAALADDNMQASDLDVGDLYLDTTNHRFYRKTLLGWAAKTAFKGADGKAGDKGDSGESALSGLLTNETHTVPSTAAGKVKSGLTEAGGTFKVYQGATELSSGVTYAVASQTSFDATYSWKIVGGALGAGLKIRVNKSTGAYDVSETASGAWTAETATADIVATHTASGSTITKTYKVSKSMGATTVMIKASGLTFRMKPDGTPLNANAFRTFKAERQGHAATGNIEWRVYGVATDGTETDLTSGTTVATLGTMLSTPSSLTVAGVSTTNTDKIYATMSGTQFDTALGSYDSIKIRATFDSIYDEVSVVPVSNGTDGTPGTNGAKTVTTSAIALNATPVGLTSYGCSVGDTLMDTVNHKIYTRATSSTWTLVGDSFKGTKGDNGTDGAGLKKYSAGLTSDTTISTSGTTLAFSDTFENVGSAVTINASYNEFTIPSNGKYKVSFYPVFDTENTYTLTDVFRKSVTFDIRAAIEKCPSGSSTWTEIVYTTVTTTLAPATPKELEFVPLEKTLTFIAGTKVRFRATRTNGANADVSNCTIKANAVTLSKGESSDTWILIEKQ